MSRPMPATVSPPTSIPFSAMMRPSTEYTSGIGL